ncbi:MAG: hypothetical protein FWF87_01315 [Synergistaceae bacterium]|nr:hypothetical protein [Synergistaceae bacterium]
MKRFTAILLTLLFASVGNAALRDRLQPILSGDLNIAVDTFIVGTQDKYVATIVRDIDDEVINDLTITLKDMLYAYDRSDLALVEKRVFDKNSKKISLSDRAMALKINLDTPLASEPLLQSELEEVAPGSAEEIIWDGVAGPDGWGTKILSDYPKPVQLSEDKWPKEADKYIPIALEVVGGLFINRDSIEIAPDGCTATAVQAFDGEWEMQMGGIVMQYTRQPYEDAIYAVIDSDYSFSKKAIRLTRYTVFGPNDKIIYSVKIAEPTWEDVDMNPMTMPSLGLIGENLPEELYSVLSADVMEFVEYAREKYDEIMKNLPPEEDKEREEETEEYPDKY